MSSSSLSLLELCSFRHRPLLLIFLSALVVTPAGAKDDYNPHNLPIPPCSEGEFQCLSSGDFAGPVTNIDECELACRICEGDNFFCPDFQVTEQEFTILSPSENTTTADDDLYFNDDYQSYYSEWNETNHTVLSPNATTTNTAAGSTIWNVTIVTNSDDDHSGKNITLSTSRAAAAATTTTTTDVATTDDNPPPANNNNNNTTKPPEKYEFNTIGATEITKASFQCQCFPVFTDTTSCERTRVRRSICVDPDYGAPGSYVPEDSSATRRGRASFFQVVLAVLVAATTTTTLDH